MTARRVLAAVALVVATGGILVATPASACTGDPCDGFCATYSHLPPAVQQKVFHSSGCPIE